MSQTMLQTSTAGVSLTANTTINPREELLSNLKGQTAHIPNLKPIFADWKGIPSRHMSPFVAPLREKMNTRIRGFDFSQRRIKQLEGADFGTFTALWWPDAPLGRLEILAYLVLWLFTWDDEIDEPTGAYSADFSGAQQYRKRTLRFVGECLGLSSAAAAADDDDSFRPQNEIVQSFDVVGAALRSACTVDQCQRFYDEIARFMQCSEDEQRGRLRGHIPSLDEYWHFRLGTSAVYIGTAVGEYATGMPVPPGVMRSAAVQGVWDETNVIISITNDLMSLRKEMKLDGIDSIVPLTFSTTGNVQQAVSQSVDALRASKERFDTAAEACLALCRDDDAVRGPVEAFIETQRSNCVGNLVWSLETLRYNMCELTGADGSQTFIL